MRLRTFVAASSAAALALALVVTPAAVADDYPSWDDVQAAKASQAATAAEVTKINDFISQLTAESAKLGAETIAKAAAYTTAQNQADAATARTDRLTAAARKATDDAAAAHSRYGRIVSQLVMTTGGQNLTVQLLLDSSRSDDLLRQLGSISKLTQQASDLEQSAKQSQNEADSLSAQAAVASAERDRLRDIAQTALTAAKAAEKAADDKLAEQRAASQTLYAQLATLTTQVADVQNRYNEGEAARQAAEAAAAAAASDAGGTIWTDDVVVDPAGAQAYARGQLSSYGWGDDQMSCLVRLWNQESGWQANAYNESSEAYGIPQSLPASKLADAGPDWRTNGNTQINWGLGYINGRYGSPCGAWSHEVGYNWY